MNPFIETGCIEDKEFKGLYSHPDLPFKLFEIDGKLTLAVNMEYHIDEGKIPATAENIRNLIKAFNP